jgi:hypothetical protein
MITTVLHGAGVVGWSGSGGYDTSLHPLPSYIVIGGLSAGHHGCSTVNAQVHLMWPTHVLGITHAPRVNFSKKYFSFVHYILTLTGRKL